MKNSLLVGIWLSIIFLLMTYTIIIYSFQILFARILSRTRSLSPDALAAVARVINAADSDAPFRYPVEQGVCQELDG